MSFGGAHHLGAYPARTPLNVARTGPFFQAPSQAAGPAPETADKKIRKHRACHACKAGHLKCDHGTPSCARCKSKGITCVYSEIPSSSPPTSRSGLFAENSPLSGPLSSSGSQFTDDPSYHDPHNAYTAYPLFPANLSPASGDFALRNSFNATSPLSATGFGNLSMNPIDPNTGMHLDPASADYYGQAGSGIAYMGDSSDYPAAPGYGVPRGYGHPPMHGHGQAGAGPRNFQTSASFGLPQQSSWSQMGQPMYPNDGSAPTTHMITDSGRQGQPPVQQLGSQHASGDSGSPIGVAKPMSPSQASLPLGALGSATSTASTQLSAKTSGAVAGSGSHASGASNYHSPATTTTSSASGRSKRSVANLHLNPANLNQLSAGAKGGVNNNYSPPTSPKMIHRRGRNNLSSGSNGSNSGAGAGSNAGVPTSATSSPSPLGMSGSAANNNNQSAGGPATSGPNDRGNSAPSSMTSSIASSGPLTSSTVTTYSLPSSPAGGSFYLPPHSEEPSSYSYTEGSVYSGSVYSGSSGSFANSPHSFGYMASGPLQPGSDWEEAQLQQQQQQYMLQQQQQQQQAQQQGPSQFHPQSQGHNHPQHGQHPHSQQPQHQYSQQQYQSYHQQGFHPQYGPTSSYSSHSVHRSSGSPSVQQHQYGMHLTLPQQQHPGTYGHHHPSANQQSHIQHHQQQGVIQQPHGQHLNYSSSSTQQQYRSHQQMTATSPVNSQWQGGSSLPTSFMYHHQGMDQSMMMTDGPDSPHSAASTGAIPQSAHASYNMNFVRHANSPSPSPSRDNPLEPNSGVNSSSSSYTPVNPLSPPQTFFMEGSQQPSPMMDFADSAPYSPFPLAPHPSSDSMQTDSTEFGDASSSHSSEHHGGLESLPGTSSPSLPGPPRRNVSSPTLLVTLNNSSANRQSSPSPGRRAGSAGLTSSTSSDLSRRNSPSSPAPAASGTLLTSSPSSSTNSMNVAVISSPTALNASNSAVSPSEPKPHSPVPRPHSPGKNFVRNQTKIHQKEQESQETTKLIDAFCGAFEPRGPVNLSVFWTPSEVRQHWHMLMKEADTKDECKTTLQELSKKLATAKGPEYVSALASLVRLFEHCVLLLCGASVLNWNNVESHLVLQAAKIMESLSNEPNLNFDENETSKECDRILDSLVYLASYHRDRAQHEQSNTILGLAYRFLEKYVHKVSIDGVDRLWIWTNFVADDRSQYSGILARLGLTPGQTAMSQLIHAQQSIVNDFLSKTITREFFDVAWVQLDELEAMVQKCEKSERSRPFRHTQLAIISALRAEIYTRWDNLAAADPYINHLQAVAKLSHGIRIGLTQLIRSMAEHVTETGELRQGLTSAGAILNALSDTLTAPSQSKPS